MINKKLKYSIAYTSLLLPALVVWTFWKFCRDMEVMLRLGMDSQATKFAAQYASDKARLFNDFHTIAAGLPASHYESLAIAALWVSLILSAGFSFLQVIGLRSKSTASA